MIVLLKEAAEIICGDDARILSKGGVSLMVNQESVGISYSDVEKKKKGDVS